MRGTAVICRRELAGLFLSPLAWILLFASVLLNGFLFSYVLTKSRDVTASLEYVFGDGLFFWGLMLVLAPLLAMRLLAEETASGTLEFLRTAPVSDVAVVLGKFLAGSVFMAVLWSSAFLYAGALELWGTSPDWGHVVTMFLGALLASSTFLAISLVTSSLTNTPLLSAFLSLMACVWWLILPMLVASLLAQMRGLLATVFGNARAVEGYVLAMLDRMSIFRHFGRSYFRGVLDTAEVVFFLTWIAFFLFLTTRALEARRWRG